VLEPATLDAMQGTSGVFHCAGMVSRRPSDAERLWQVHVTGTKNVLAAMTRLNVPRLVLASTSGTIAVSTDDTPLAEDAPTPLALISRWPYYRSKLFAERAALEATGVEVVCINPSLLLGPGDVRGSSTEDVRLFLEGKLMAVPQGGASFVDARDAAQALTLGMHKGKAGERYLISACNLSVRDMFGRLERLSGRKAPWLPLPKNIELAKAATRLAERMTARLGGKSPVTEADVDVAQHYWYCDWSKAKRDLGFQPRDPNDTLRDTVADLFARGVVLPRDAAEWRAAAANP
jgi:dihydroflavonol-4-reductase